MDSRDAALQSTLPTVMVPRFSELEELSQPGSRLLIARNGVWLETKRAWIYARLRVGAISESVALPYGETTETIRLLCGSLPRAGIAQFIEIARERCPNECAAWGIWNEVTGEFRLEMLDETSVGNAHVKTILPILAEGEHMVLDIHSHGRFPAGFSPVDDKDDRGENKVAFVVGNLDKETVTMDSRLCLEGLFLSLPPPFHIGGQT